MASDFPEAFARSGSVPLTATPAMAVRYDKAASIAGATNNALGCVQMDATGALRVTNEGGAPTYSATSLFAAGSTGGVIAMLAGQTYTTVKLLKVIVSTVATASGNDDLTFQRVSTQAAGGTTGTPTVVKFDTGSPGASAGPVHWTVNPTAGSLTSGGTVMGARIIQPNTGVTAAAVQPIVFDFTNQFGAQGLRIGPTSNEAIQINAPSGLCGAGNKFAITWIWKEEPITA